MYPARYGRTVSKALIHFHAVSRISSCAASEYVFFEHMGVTYRRKQVCEPGLRLEEGHP